MRAIIFPVIAIAALAACEAGTTPTATTADLLTATSEFNRLDAMPTPAIADLPSATAGYTGKFLGSVDVNDTPDHDIIGDLELSINFTGTGQMSGEVSNINMFSDNAPDQLLGGTLAVVGTAPNGVIDATASGMLDLVGFDLPFRATADVSFIMNGSAREDAGFTTNETSVVGTWSGGTVDPGPEFTMTNGSGTFFATEN